MVDFPYIVFGTMYDCRGPTVTLMGGLEVSGQHRQGATMMLIRSADFPGRVLRRCSGYAMG
eukprot:3311720-Pyramimonas_sp.AAC.1